MSRTIISTPDAPAAIGTYSQATRHGNVVYLSGQIPLNPQTMELVEGDIDAQIHRVFQNLSAVCKAAGGGFVAIGVVGAGGPFRSIALGPVPHRHRLVVGEADSVHRQIELFVGEQEHRTAEALGQVEGLHRERVALGDR